MSAVSHYWYLQRLDSTGQCRRQRFENARTWLERQCTELIAAADMDTDSASGPENRSLQAHLLARWQKAPEQAALALLCLRCCVSHAIRQACLQLVSQFGEYYQFRGVDLFPFVLDDDGRPISRYRPLGIHIIETFAQGQASLESWAMHLTRNHSELNQFLLEQGLYRVSDWAILNDTTPGQLPRILGEFHTLTQTEIVAAQKLLDAYHQIYRRDRFQQRQRGKGGRCEIPSEVQLQAIDDTLAPQVVLAQLQQLAYWLRQYRIQARGGTPMAEPLETIAHTEILASETSEADTQQADFLQTYREQVQEALAEAMTEVLTAYCQKLRRKQPSKAEAFLQALALFHCEGQGMKDIAPQVGLKTQVQVTRLMNLKRLRADVGQAWLTRLQARIQDAVLKVTSAEHLSEISHRLESLLAEEGDRLVAEATAEAQMAKNRTAKSLFARQLCASLQDLIPCP